MRILPAVGLALSLLACSIFGTACSKKPDVNVTPDSSSDVSRHSVRGVVRALDLPGRIVVEHEDIPGFMPSMTMPFTAVNPEEIASLQVGEAVTFQFVVTADDAWIEEVQPISASDLQLPEKPARPSRAEQRAPRVREGDRLPDFQLVDQDGRELSPATYAGKYLILTFIFTRCPVPNFCPRISENFQQLAAVIGADPALAEQVRLLSISFDPEFDTPEVLSAYGRALTEDLDFWRFATGAPEAVDPLTQAFAVYVKPEKGTIDHGLCTALVAPDGTIETIWRGNGWTPEEIVTALKALVNQAPEKAAHHDPSQSRTTSPRSQSFYEKHTPNHAS